MELGSSISAQQEYRHCVRLSLTITRLTKRPIPGAVMRCHAIADVPHLSAASRHSPCWLWTAQAAPTSATTLSRQEALASHQPLHVFVLSMPTECHASATAPAPESRCIRRLRLHRSRGIAIGMGSEKIFRVGSVGKHLFYSRAHRCVERAASCGVANHYAGFGMEGGVGTASRRGAVDVKMRRCHSRV